jgi:MFS transporter, DHA1 family, multidrug resistance protein
MKVPLGALQQASSGWKFLLAVFVVAHGLDVASWGHIQAFQPLFIERELHVPLEEVARWTGLLAAAPLLVAAPISPFWGVLADRFGPKLVILRCFFIGGVAYVAVALAQDVWQFLGIRLLQGLTFGTNAVIIAALAAIVPSRQMGMAIGMTQMVFPVGNSIGPLFGSGLIAWLGLRGMFVFDAAMSVLSFVLVYLLYREPPRKPNTEQTMLQQVADVGRTVWRLAPLRLAFIVMAVYACGWTLTLPFLPLLIARVYDGPDLAFAIGATMAVFGAVAGVAAPLVGRATDRFGPSRVVAFNMIGLAVMCGGLALATTPLQVGVVMLIGAVPFGASNTALFAHLARHTPRQHMSAVMSLTPLARNGAMVLGPLIGAAVAGFGIWAIFATACAVYSVASALSLLMWRQCGDDRAPLAQPDSAGA